MNSLPQIEAEYFAGWFPVYPFAQVSDPPNPIGFGQLDPFSGAWSRYQVDFLFMRRQEWVDQHQAYLGGHATVAPWAMLAPPEWATSSSAIRMSSPMSSLTELSSSGSSEWTTPPSRLGSPIGTSGSFRDPDW